MGRQALYFVGVLAGCGRLDFTSHDAPSPTRPLMPGNGLDAELAVGAGSVAIDGVATLDGDSGAITGSITRAAGSGVIDDIGYFQVSPGVAAFTFGALDIAGELRFTPSTHAVVLFSATHLRVAGTVDASAGCYGGDPACQGPGGGHGAHGTSAASGCAPGDDGERNGVSTRDGGGGGGAGSTNGGRGGDASPTQGGTAGLGCVPALLEPLLGGSGGGRGGYGGAANMNAGTGGGGGGAIQLTALARIEVTGVIAANGAGGRGGPALLGNAGAGAGGGGGGGILIEAPFVVFAATSVLAANGGGGGGGSHDAQLGVDGKSGNLTPFAAPGGMASTGTNGDGGAGAATAALARPGGSGSTNGGGGGGGIGAIHVRADSSPATPAVSSPTFTFAVY